MFRFSQFVFAWTLLLLLMGCFCPVLGADMECPGGMEPTIASLRECVEHATVMGHISSSGVALTLLAKLDVAAAAEGRDHVTAAANILEAFINEVRAQSGKTIDAEHADHMIDHTLLVIAALLT